MMWTRSANSHTGPRLLNGRTSEAGQMSAPDYTQRLTDRIFLLSPGVSTDVSGLEVRLCHMPRAGMEIRRPGADQKRER
jgi:hypothetical protein